MTERMWLTKEEATAIRFDRKHGPHHRHKDTLGFGSVIDHRHKKPKRWSRLAWIHHRHRLDGMSYGEMR